LIDARKNANLTQNQIASRLGISEGYYSYIESGERQKKMDITFAVKLAEVLGIPIQTVIDLEKNVPHNVS
jgi:transcriptional regulator with XRE-family HTH domain